MALRLRTTRSIVLRGQEDTDKDEAERIREECIARVQSAGVPSSYWRGPSLKALPVLGDGGVALRRDIVEGRAEHFTSSKGAFISGESQSRLESLPLLAKELALCEEPVLYTTLTKLVTTIMAGGDRDFERIFTIKCLCIDWFQNSHKEFPFTPAERARVEDMLHTRVKVTGRYLYLSATKPLANCDWWSEEIRNTLGYALSNYRF